jgi:hypothetical protein
LGLRAEYSAYPAPIGANTSDNTPLPLLSISQRCTTMTFSNLPGERHMLVLHHDERVKNRIAKQHAGNRRGQG